MIEESAFLRVVRRAYLVLQRFQESKDMEFGEATPAKLLEGTPPHGRAPSKQRIDRARAVVESRVAVEVVPVSKQLHAGYGSWLMPLKDGRPRIYIDTHQLRQWERARGASFETQFARCILHELGHIELHPHLLSNAKPGEYVSSASESEENEGWIFAMTLLGMALGHHSMASKMARDLDVAPAIPL